MSEEAVPDPVDADARRWLEAEREAFLAAESGDLDTAIAGWSSILGDAQGSAFFAEGGDEGDEDGPLRQIAADLANACLIKGDDEHRAQARQLIDQWGLQVSEASATDETAGG